MARWNDDGSCAPTARVRSGKGEPFCLTLTKQEIEDDVAMMFDSEVRPAARPLSRVYRRAALTPPSALARSWATSARSEVRVAATGHHWAASNATAPCNPRSSDS